MKYLFVFALVFLSFSVCAQIPEDAFRMSWITPTGTARQQAIGGAMGSLGGEISAAYVNPAGLGFYKTSEMVLTPGFRSGTDKSNYLGQLSKGSAADNFNLGTSGFVFSALGQNGGSHSFCLAVNRMANFNSHVGYSGTNNYSSFSEQYAEEFSNSGLSINDALNSPNISYGTRMALYTYLIDTATVNGSLQVIGQPQKVLNAGGSLNQVYRNDSKGGITELALSYAGNLRDKLMIGFTLGVPIVSYTRNLSITETDATGNANNDFSSATYSETYSSRGAGVNLKFGVIYKASSNWRFGLAVHTPTWYTLTDRLSSGMTANTEAYAQTISITSAALDEASGTAGNEVKYNLSSPWRVIGSGSYIFGAVSDVKRQKGFITADVEYLNTRGPRFSAVDNPDGSSGDNTYYNSVNSVIKSYYKNSFNLRLGGELKFNILAARAGIAYYSNPYAQGTPKADKLFISGGAGYRNKGFFVDLTYVWGLTKDQNYPYRLSDKANLPASVKENAGTVLLTVGFKFG